MKVIGLAGEAGCGKSAVGKNLAERKGIVWADLDELAWETYRPNTPTYKRLISHFGEGILASNGDEIDRSKLAQIVFSDSEALAYLNEVVHPVLNERMRVLIGAEAAKGTRILLFEGALLGVSPHVDYSLFDAILWLVASRETRAERLRAAGRAQHLEREASSAKVTKTVEIDAEGSVEEISKCILEAIERLPASS
ncbi:dephospho-CoA kinase [Candidatus Bipolaricaulota bacterium]|nr:dephospho-CoA kinase [Candidatus Bipolaricaulota bacterium]